MDLVLDALKANADLRVNLAFPDPGDGSGPFSITGYTRRGFQFGMRSEYTAAGSNMAQQALTKLVNGVKEFLNEYLEKDLSQVSIEHPAQTINFWTGSIRPSFSIPLMFIAVNPDDDVRQPVIQLSSGVAPSIGSITGTGLDQFYKAPLGYAPTLGIKPLSPQGTISVEIGRWFRAFGLNMKSSSFIFSAHVPTPRGLPYWAEGEVELVPYKAVTYRDVQDFFRTVA